MSTPAVTRLRIGHLSSLFTASSASFMRDVELVMRRRPHIVSFTEVAARRDELRAVVKHFGYRCVFHETRECASIYDHHNGVRLVRQDETRATDANKGGGAYTARSIYEAEFEYTGESITHHYWHNLAHLADYPVRVPDHNKITAVAIDRLKLNSRGTGISTFGCDANEADHPGEREDDALGNMARQFAEAGITTTWDETGRHPSTFGRRDPIDLLGTVDRDHRVSVLAARAIEVEGDHDYSEADLAITPREGVRP